MDMINTFLNGMVKEQVCEKNVRLLGIEKILKQSIQGSISNFSKEKLLNHGSVSAMVNGRRAIPLTLVNIEKINFGKVRWIIDGSSPVKIPSKMEEKLAYLVGALRDGTVSEDCKEYTVAFYSIDKTYLKKIRMMIDCVFNLKPKIRRFGDCLGLRIRSKVIYLFFRIVFEAESKQIYWNTPKIIKKSKNRFKRAYISGFFDAEGSVPRFERLKKIKKKNLYARFVQKNKESLEFIKEELEKNEINCGKVYWSDNKYNLKISNSSIKSFSEFIESQYPKKAKRLYKLAKIFSL